MAGCVPLPARGLVGKPRASGSSFRRKTMIRVEKRLDWELTKGCNLHCAHCISRAYHPLVSRELKKGESRDIVRRCARFGMDEIHFFGGEPTLRSDFADLLEMADACGIRTAFTTNATRLDREFIDRLSLFDHLRGIYFSMEAIEPAPQDTIRGRGVFAAVTQALRTCAEQLPGVDLSVSFTLTRQALTGLHPGRILDFAKRLGAVRVIFQELAVPDKPEPGLSALAYGAPEWFGFMSKLYAPDFLPGLPFVHELKPLVAEYFNRALGAGLPPVFYGCNGLSTEFRLLPDGTLLPCSAAVAWPEVLAEFLYQVPTLAEKEFDEILDMEPYRRFRRLKLRKQGAPHMVPCSRCSFVYRQCNPCVFGRYSGRAHKMTPCTWVQEMQGGEAWLQEA